MNKILRTLAAGTLFFTLAAITPPILAQSVFSEPTFRVVQRIKVRFCEAPSATPVNVTVVAGQDEEGNDFLPGVEVEGELPAVELDCALIDSRIGNRNIEGEMFMWRDGNEGPITKIMYTAIMRDGRATYAMADFVNVPANAWEGNGAQYNVCSNLMFEEDGRRHCYPITFMRNAPAEQWVELPGYYSVRPDLGEEFLPEGFYPTGWLAPAYDPTTVLEITKVIDGGYLILTIDYTSAGVL